MKRRNLFVVIVLGLVMLLGSVAYAEVTTVTPPSGSTPGVPGPTGSDPSVAWSCQGEALYRNGLLASERVPICPLGSNDWRWTGDYVHCIVAYDVYRFYGTASSPTAASSLSRADLPDPCNANPELLLFFPHPDDASGGTPASAPFRTGTTPSAIYTSRTPHLTSLGGVTYFTTSPPVALSPNRCDDFMPTNSGIRDFFRNAAGVEGVQYNEPEAQQIRDIFFAEYQSRITEGSLAFAQASLDVADVQNGELWLGNSTPCDSDVDFSIREGAQERVASTCWVPISRELRVYESPSFPGQQIFAENFFRLERYGLPEDPSITVQPPSAFRSTIANSVNNRPLSIRTPDPSDTAIVSGFTAASQSANIAECATTTGANVSSATSAGVSTPQPTSAVVTVDLPEVAQVGGELRLADLDFSTPELMCGSTACPTTGASAPRVTGTQAVSAALVAPESYPANTFYSSINPTRLPTQVTAGFLQATAPGEEFTVDVSGTLQVRGDLATSVEVNLTNPLGTGTTSGITVDTSVAVFWDVPITVQFADETSFPVVGSAPEAFIGR